MRNVQIVAAEHRGTPILIAHDPMGILEQPVGLVADPMLLIVLQLADGQHTVGEMASMATQATGQIISAEVLRAVVEQLDQALLLFSERFAQHWQAKRDAYKNAPKRESSVFRVASLDRLKFMADLGAEFRRHGMSSISPPERIPLPPDSVVGVLAPHIDYMRGGEVYNWSYRALTEAGTRPDTFFILGQVHRPAMHRFIATKKTFETPFGDVDVDADLLEEFSRNFGGELYEDEYQHATEHSIELQVVYLKKLLGDRPFRIVPIVLSSFDDLLDVADSPAVADQEVSDFCGALRTVLDARGDSLALVGGVDFSHCGPEFGDEQLNDEARMKEIEAGDRAALDAIEAVDGDAFFDTFRPDFNARKVCSLGPIYCTLKAMQGRAKAQVLQYHQANSADRACLVSFASVAFLKPNAEVKPKSKIILLD